MVNLAKDKDFFINHAYRNTLENKSNKVQFKYTFIFLMLVITVALILHLYHYLKWRTIR
jgi:hypothetical protein